MADEFFLGTGIRHLDSDTNLRATMSSFDQTGVGSAGGDPISDTSWASFDLTNVTIAGFGYFKNLGTNDVSLSLLITTATEGAVNYPFGIAIPGVRFPFYWDPTVKATNPLQHKTASGTSVIQWRIWQV